MSAVANNAAGLACRLGVLRGRRVVFAATGTAVASGMRAHVGSVAHLATIEAGFHLPIERVEAYVHAVVKYPSG